MSADEFALRALVASPEQVAAIVRQQAADLQKPPYSVPQLIDKLEANGLIRFAAKLRQLSQ